MIFKKSLLVISLMACLMTSSFTWAETIETVGKTEVSIKASNDLVNARRLARSSSERDAILSALKVKLNVDINKPDVQSAIAEIAKQMSGNNQLPTTYITEGDIVTATSRLKVESGELFDMARSLKLVNTGAMNLSKVMFIIDEYKGIATNIEAGQPLETEIHYSHDKSKASASSSSSASASSAKDSSAVSASQKSAYAASDNAKLSTRNNASIAGNERVNVAATDGYGGSAAASRNTSVAASRNSSVDASRNQSAAGSSQANYTAAASSEKNSAKSAKSASVSSEKDIVNYSVKQKFPEVNNAKPSDDASALIAVRLEEKVKEFGLKYLPESDLRISKGKKLLITEIVSQSKSSQIIQDSGKRGANYFVFGTAVMSIEGKTPSGDTTCSGQLKLQATSVDTGDGLVSGTLLKRASGANDQECYGSLATALATELASTIGNTATKDIQLAATQGTDFLVTIASSKKLKLSIQNSFQTKLESLSEQIEESNQTINSKTFSVKGKSDFMKQMNGIVAEMEDANPEITIVKKGSKIIICIDGQCAKDL